MGTSKGGSTTTKVEVNPAIEKAAKQNLQLANVIAAMPFQTNRAIQIAAFSPMQNAAFAGTDAAASAFGLQGSGGQTGLPEPQALGGFSGYSPAPFFDAAQKGLSPEYLEARRRLNETLQNNAAGNKKDNSSGKGGNTAMAMKGGVMDPNSVYQQYPYGGNGGIR